MKKIIKGFEKMFGRDDLFAPANAEQIEKLRTLIGDKAYVTVDFFSRYQPVDIPMTNSYVQLMDIDHILAENTTGEPGRFLAQYGVFVFAVTVGGNVICVDTVGARRGDPAVLIADSGFCAENEQSGCVEITVMPEKISDKLADDEILTLSYKNILRCLPRVEKTFTKFMTKLSQGKYEDLEELLDE